MKYTKTWISIDNQVKLLMEGKFAEEYSIAKKSVFCIGILLQTQSMHGP